MAGPWERYRQEPVDPATPDQTTAPAVVGPWERYQQPQSFAANMADFGMGALRGTNRALVGALTAPYRALDWGIEKLTGTGGLPNVEDMSLYRPYLQQPEATTTAGRYGRTVGESIGMTLPLTGGLLAAAPRLAAMAPTSTARAVGQQVGSAFAAAPTAAVAADVVSATGAGLAQQAAEDAGAGPGWQALAGLAGGLAPMAVAQAVSSVPRAVQSSRANSDPHARFANKLGDQSIDDLANAVATGNTGINADNARRTLDILGEEMVRTGSNRAAAVDATVQRLQAELGVTENTARDHVRRLTAAHADSNLVLSEYPAIAQSDLDTRGLQHSRTAIEAAQVLGVDQLQTTGRAADKIAVQRLMDELGITKGRAIRRLRAARALLEDEQAAGHIQSTGAHTQIDYLANAGSGPSANIAKNAVMDRLPALREQANDVLHGMSPGRRTIEDVDNMIAAMQRQASQEYNAVHSTAAATNYNLLNGPNNQGGMIQRIIQRHLQRAYDLGGDQADALREALGRLYVARPPTTQNARGELPLIQNDIAMVRANIREARRQRVDQDSIDDMNRILDGLVEGQRLARRELTPRSQEVATPSLLQLQNARMGIRGQMEEARSDIATILRPLYRDLTRVMERASPQWRVANRRWADMNLEIRAKELGEAFAERAGPEYRRQLGDFRALAPEAQDVVRIHFVRKLLDKIVNVGDTHDLAKLFSTPHMRNAVRTILGDEAAMDLARLVRDNRVATMSKNMLSGSQTHVRGERQAAENVDLGILASVEQANFRGFRKAMLDRAIGWIREGRDRRLAKVVTTPMRDTAAVAENIDRMRYAQERARYYANRPPLPSGWAGRLGPVPGVYPEDEN